MHGILLLGNPCTYYAAPKYQYSNDTKLYMFAIAKYKTKTIRTFSKWSCPFQKRVQHSHRYLVNHPCISRSTLILVKKQHISRSFDYRKWDVGLFWRNMVGTKNRYQFFKCLYFSFVNSPRKCQCNWELCTRDFNLMKWKLNINSI